MGFDKISGYMVNFVQQGEDTVVANLVIDKRSLPLHLQKMIVSQLLQVVGDQGLGQLKLFNDLRNGFLVSADTL